MTSFGSRADVAKQDLTRRFSMALVLEDDAQDEARCVLVGTSERGRVLTVVYTMRGDVPRLISARKATAGEKASYED